MPRPTACREPLLYLSLYLKQNVRPILSLSATCEAMGLSFPAASSGMELLSELGIARELTGKRRNRLFVYDRQLALLNEGTEVQ